MLVLYITFAVLYFSLFLSLYISISIYICNINHMVPILDGNSEHVAMLRMKEKWSYRINTSDL